jgi:hypothetical protein
VGDKSHLTSFSIDGEYTPITFSEATQSLSNGLRVDSDGVVLQKPHRGLSPLVFDLPPALASTVSSCRSALGTRAQIRDLRIDSRGSLLWSASVTDNFGNRDNLGRGASEHQKAWEKPYLVGSKGYSGDAYRLGY